jgi:hypothetical protein
MHIFGRKRKRNAVLALKGRPAFLYDIPPYHISVGYIYIHIYIQVDCKTDAAAWQTSVRKRSLLMLVVMQLFVSSVRMVEYVHIFHIL